MPWAEVDATGAGGVDAYARGPGVSFGAGSVGAGRDAVRDPSRCPRPARARYALYATLRMYLSPGYYPGLHAHGAALLGRSCRDAMSEWLHLDATGLVHTGCLLSAAPMSRGWHAGQVENMRQGGDQSAAICKSESDPLSSRRVTAQPGHGCGAGRGRGRGRVALSATVARRPRDGSRFRRRSCDAGLGPPARGPRPSGDPSRMKQYARRVGDRRRQVGPSEDILVTANARVPLPVCFECCSDFEKLHLWA
eukprot:350742-Chlamydomonas_euryale.AAC.18